MIIGVILSLLIGGGIFFVSQTAKQKKPAIEMKSVGEPTTSFDKRTNLETTKLVAVGNYSGTAKATRSYDGKTFSHTVEAKIGDPAEGKFYEGWLVMQEPELNFISTGKLIKKENVYNLTFKSDKDFLDYLEVVITEETESLGLDGNPEDHVLEGSF